MFNYVAAATAKNKAGIRAVLRLEKKIFNFLSVFHVGFSTLIPMEYFLLWNGIHSSKPGF